MAIITISRGSFGDGKTVAERVGQHLNHPVLSREDVLRQAANTHGVQELELARVLNETPS
jgi:cytidylate kinase